MRRRGLQFGPLSAPDCETEYTCALQNTMAVYKLDALKPQILDEKQQIAILNTLHAHCVQYMKLKFQQNPLYYDPEEHAKKWPWWSAQNDTLRKIVFGTYKGSTLPIPFVNAIRKIPDNAFRSFFTQRCIVYHNSLHANSPETFMDEHGALILGQAASKFTQEHFKSIDITIPVVLLAKASVHPPAPAPLAPAAPAPAAPAPAAPAPAAPAPAAPAPAAPPRAPKKAVHSQFPLLTRFSKFRTSVLDLSLCSTELFITRMLVRLQQK